MTVMASTSAQAAGAPNVSSGCAAINAGALDGTGTSGTRLMARYLIEGDLITVNYALPDGGELRFYVPDDNGDQVLARVNAASGTFSVTLGDFTQALALASSNVAFTSTVTCTPGTPRLVVHPRVYDALSDQETSINADVAIEFDYETVQISRQPAHGTARYASGNLYYTPNPGFTGYDEYSYTATNNGVTSLPASVRMRVAPGPLWISPGNGTSLGTARIGQPVTMQLTAMDCAGVCTFQAHSSNFAGGDISLDPVTGLLTVIPREASAPGDPLWLSVAVSDEGVKVGRGHATAAYQLNVPAEEVPTARASTHRALPGDSALLKASVSGQTLWLTVIEPPTHGYAYPYDKNTILYYPDDDYVGPDTLQIVASNDFGDSEPVTMTINVGDPAITPEAGDLPRAELGRPYEVQFRFDPQLASPAFSLSSGTLPEGLTLSGSGLLSGTPVNMPAGTYLFTIRGVSPNYAGEYFSNYTLTVADPQVGATDKTVEIQPGATPLPVDLTAGATGGPFTDAAILSVEPPTAGTATLTMGEYASLAADWVPGKFYLKFIPNPNFKGTAVVRYALRGASGVSNSASVTFTVPLGIAAIANQVDGLVRGFVSTRQSMLAERVEQPGLIDRRQMGSGQRPGTVNVSPAGNSVSMNFASSLAELKSWGEAGDAAGALAAGPSEADAFNLWIDGSLTLHLRTDDGQEHSGNFGLLSMGADYLVNDRLLAGVALHIDTMRDDAASTGTTGQGMMIGPYLSMELGEGVFLDASLLYGRSWNDVSTGHFAGSFETERWLGKAKLEGLWQLNELLTLRPDATMVLTTENVMDYSVNNELGDEITIAGFTSTQVRLSAGGTLEYVVALDSGLTLIPQVSGSVGLSATNAARLSPAAFGTIGTGLTLTGGGNWTVGGTLDLGLDANGLRSATARSSLGVRF